MNFDLLESAIHRKLLNGVSTFSRRLCINQLHPKFGQTLIIELRGLTINVEFLVTLRYKVPAIHCLPTVIKATSRPLIISNRSPEVSSPQISVGSLHEQVRHQE